MTLYGARKGDQTMVKVRCFGAGDPLYEAYHDEEWGRPVADSPDERELFERVCLEGFQAGLSWITVLRKRDAFRAAFAGFDPAVVAEFGDDDVTRLMADAGIVRNRLKIEATVTNARALLALHDEGERLADLVASGFLTKTAVARGKQGRYSLTELGLSTVPLLVELGHLGARIDPTTSRYAPSFGDTLEERQARLDALRQAHLGNATAG